MFVIVKVTGDFILVLIDILAIIIIAEIQILKVTRIEDIMSDPEK